MDINQLNCFITVAQTLNFSEAARRNYVSQSTVSRYVSDLEKEFGVQKDKENKYNKININFKESKNRYQADA